MKELQMKVEKFCRQHGLAMPEESNIVPKLTLVSEEMLDLKPEYPEEKAELGDLFYALLAFANKKNIDLEEALDMVLVRYYKKIKP